MVGLHRSIAMAEESIFPLLIMFSYFRGTNQLHLRVAEPQALLPVQSVPGGHVHHASLSQPHPASGHHVRGVHHGGPREPLGPGLGSRRLPSKARELPAGQLPALCSRGKKERGFTVECQET